MKVYHSQNDPMIYVLIERTVAQQMLSTYIKNSKLALQQTYCVDGFISGESYADENNPNKRFVFCKWRTLQDWKNWYNSQERLQVMNVITPILSEPEKISILNHD